MNASLITAANPALIVVMAIVLLGEKTTRLGWLGICLGLLGVLLVLTQGELQRVVSLAINTGELMMIGAIIVWGFYTIVARRLAVPRHRGHSRAGGDRDRDAGAVCPRHERAVSRHRRPKAGRLAYIALFPSLGSYLLWNLALKTTPSGTAGNYLNLMVVFTAIITVLFGTPLTLVQIAGRPPGDRRRAADRNQGPGPQRRPPQRQGPSRTARRRFRQAGSLRQPGHDGRIRAQHCPGRAPPCSLRSSMASASIRPGSIPRAIAAPPRKAPFMAHTTSACPAARRWNGQFSSTRPPPPSSSGQ